ncbi:MAG: hypothetical protein D6772_10045, partial [Bacteroidetes bacterium]
MRDAVGCEVGIALEVDVDAPELEVRNLMRATCGQANGSFEVFVSGGQPPYQLTLNGVAVGSDTLFTDLPVGNYSVGVTDAGGCTTLLTGIALSGESIPVLDEIIRMDARCGDANGSLTLNVVGGTPPYEYRLNNGRAQSSNVFNNLAAGSYTIQVVDAANCSLEASTEIIAIAPVFISVDSLAATRCAQANGLVRLSAQGEAPFTYALGGGDFQAEPLFTNLEAGEYQAVVRSANACTDTTFVKIGESTGIRLAPEFTVQPATCTEDVGRIQFSFLTDAVGVSLDLNGQPVSAIN